MAENNFNCVNDDANLQGDKFLMLTNLNEVKGVCAVKLTMHVQQRKILNSFHD